MGVVQEAVGVRSDLRKEKGEAGAAPKGPWELVESALALTLNAVSGTGLAGSRNIWGLH